MKLLLDTNVLIWWLENPSQLSKDARVLIREGDNLVYISAAAIWEITIKKSLNKLQSPDNLESLIKEENFLLLPITANHAFALKNLPSYHKDPFDRIQITQAQMEGLTFLTRDKKIMKYNISILPA